MSYEKYGGFDASSRWKGWGGEKLVSSTKALAEHTRVDRRPPRAETDSVGGATVEQVCLEHGTGRVKRKLETPFLARSDNRPDDGYINEL